MGVRRLDLDSCEGVAFLIDGTGHIVQYANGNAVDLIGNIGQLIWMIHKQTQVPLAELGKMLNAAVEAAELTDKDEDM